MKFSKYLHYVNPNRFNNLQLVAAIFVNSLILQTMQIAGMDLLSAVPAIIGWILIVIAIGRFCKTDFAGKAWNIFLGAVIIDMFRGRK
jgi:NAD/NADP transhydrogenase alpha subunit